MTVKWETAPNKVKLETPDDLETLRQHVSWCLHTGLDKYSNSTWSTMVYYGKRGNRKALTIRVYFSPTKSTLREETHVSQILVGHDGQMSYARIQNAIAFLLGKVELQQKSYLAQQEQVKKNKEEEAAAREYLAANGVTFPAFDGEVRFPSGATMDKMTLYKNKLYIALDGLTLEQMVKIKEILS